MIYVAVFFIIFQLFNKIIFTFF